MKNTFIAISMQDTFTTELDRYKKILVPVIEDDKKDELLKEITKTIKEFIDKQ